MLFLWTTTVMILLPTKASLALVKRCSEKPTASLTHLYWGGKAGKVSLIRRLSHCKGFCSTRSWFSSSRFVNRSGALEQPNYPEKTLLAQGLHCIIKCFTNFFHLRYIVLFVYCVYVHMYMYKHVNFMRIKSHVNVGLHGTIWHCLYRWPNSQHADSRREKEN